jgi:L-rhamnose isomerase
LSKRRRVSGGILATGNYPYKAKNGEELRSDLDMVLKLTPGTKRINLHSFYSEPDGGSFDRTSWKPPTSKNG